MAGVDVWKISGQVKSLSGDSEQEGDHIRQELRVGETEVQGQQLSADGEVGVLGVVAGRINPVVLIGSCEQFKFFEDKFKFPSIGNKREDIRGTPAGSIFNHFLKKTSLFLKRIFNL